MKLDILIPTFNRSHFVKSQLTHIANLRSRLRLSNLKVEILVLVSDNHSAPPVEISEQYSGFVQLLKPPRFLNSGEENLMFALEFCTGDYVWTLGDDDVPQMHNLMSLFEQILDSEPDLVVASSSVFLKDGTILPTVIPCSDTLQVRSLPDFVSRTGIWYILTGFSHLIFRRDAAQKRLERFRFYFGLSKIYSYAIFLLETFWSKKFFFYNRPIVLSTQNDYGDSWDLMALNDGVYSRFFWTGGFIRQLRALKASMRVEDGYFSTILDQRSNSRFHLMSQICVDLLYQLKRDLGPAQMIGRPITQAEFDEVAEFLCQEDPRLMLILAPLIKGQGLAQLNLDVVNHAFGQAGKCSAYFYHGFYIKFFAGWNIYFFDKVFRAVPQNREQDCMNELRDIAPVSSCFHVVASNLSDLEKKLIDRERQQPMLADLDPDDAFSSHERGQLRFVLQIYNGLKRFFPKKATSALGTLISRSTQKPSNPGPPCRT